MPQNAQNTSTVEVEHSLETLITDEWITVH